ncbi:hypothetical protein NC653_016998 [Populus alba x Populus x berolinensis]|uniref:Uncharacterized protein n=1 Tax=Populus alba x Populus x berolinensis TaxID=444605 RepID=A0AAD6QPE5_9ROSI|nr:hypothetical protein NC653_016998 [Populus alba x Populus x berolinensis]
MQLKLETQMNMDYRMKISRQLGTSQTVSTSAYVAAEAKRSNGLKVRSGIVQFDPEGKIRSCSTSSANSEQQNSAKAANDNRNPMRPVKKSGDKLPPTSGQDLGVKAKIVPLKYSSKPSSSAWKIDFVEEDDLRRAVDNCSHSHRQFEKKVLEFKQKFGDAKRKVEELFACGASSSIRNLDLAIKERQPSINEQKSIMQSLSKLNSLKHCCDNTS